MNNIYLKEKVRAGQPYLYRKNGLPSEVYEVRFKENIDHNSLNSALTETICRYPYFKVRFTEKNGEFYTQENDLPFEAAETEELIPLGGAENNYYLISVTHFEEYLNVSFHHGLTDGRGIKSFIETLVSNYCKVRFGSECVSSTELSDEEFAEPCGEKYPVDKNNLKKINGLGRKGYTLPETKLPPVRHRRYELRFSQEEFISVCKKYGASPVILLSVMMSKAIRGLHPEAENINSNFPVDARNELGVPQTYKNCVKSVSLPYSDSEETMSTDELCTYYKQLLNAQRTPDHCRDEFNKIIMLLNAVDHLHSYKKKRMIMRFLDNLKLDTYLISYIGQFSFGGNEKYIDSVHLFSDCSDGLVMNMTCECGYFNIDLVQDFESEDYLNALVRQFSAEGIALEVSGKIGFCTPCDTLMRDMIYPPAILKEPVLKRIEHSVAAAYRTVEKGAVSAMTAISDGFVRMFLLRDGETVQEAKLRLNNEQIERIKKQNELILSANRYGLPKNQAG